MCGIIGISSTTSVAQELYDGLGTLQHRGQDAAGIMTFNGQFRLNKGNGLVRDVFSPEIITSLSGSIGIAHVRYPTAGCHKASEAQPFYVNAPFGIGLVHNGNLTNYFQLVEEMQSLDLRRIDTTSDSEILLNVFAHELAKQKNLRFFTPEHVFRTVTNMFKRIKGSCSAVCLIGDKGLVGFRDPHGIRPLAIGVRENMLKNEYIIASEDVAIKTLGFKFMRDVAPGEAVFIDMHGALHTRRCAQGEHRPCIFEYVYLARPDSILDKISVYKARLRMGEKLARQVRNAKIKIDAVIPIPETSRSIAITLAHALGVKYREGFVKNRYIGRTFIMPGQEIRRKSLRLKLNPIELEFRNKNVLLVDDSIVRGNTSQWIIRLAREVGAKKVYLALAAPELRYQCVFGVDMPSKRELVAHNNTIEQVAKIIGADALFYQKLEDLIEAARRGNPQIKKFCVACFNGDYLAEYVDDKVLRLAEGTRGELGYEEEKNQLTLV